MQLKNSIITTSISTPAQVVFTSVPIVCTGGTAPHYLAAVLVERATHGDAVYATAHLENRK